jgi:hypothetical protein
MSLRDVLKPNATEEAEIRRLETLLDQDEAGEPRPGFDTRFFARLEEEKQQESKRGWRSFGLYIFAPVLAAAGLALFLYLKGPGPELAQSSPTAPAPGEIAPREEVARPSETRAADALPRVAESALPVNATEQEPSGFEGDAELALDLELADDLDLVERLDEAEGAELLAELDRAKLEDKEFEALLAEVTGEVTTQ